MDTRKYGRLMDGWDSLVETLTDNGYVEKEEIQHLCFDTYHFLRAEIGESEVIPKKLLPIYKAIGNTQILLYSNPLSEYLSESETGVFLDIMYGLCDVVEEGFDAGYGEYPLPLGTSRRTPAGGMDPEADMTSFESFQKSFEDYDQMLQEEYGMEQE